MQMKAIFERDLIYGFEGEPKFNSSIEVKAAVGFYEMSIIL